ncbi:organelle RRM domain-containing protein 2, mitochondrial-like [Silene latifolia]|uniref:organelle RRM domain-containing protein 2, mitochondrial-like n=1 Tax=Silene latifolia TaxID=37657 RepID=UPI003D776CDD
MAMKAAVMAAMSATKPRGLNRYCTSAFNFTPPQPSSQQPAAPVADPSPNLFVSGLSKRTTTDGLHEAFSKFGQVVHAKVVTDHVSGFSKGFGFVKYATTEEAKSGIEGMNGAFLDGWVIFAEFAKPRPAPAYQQQSRSPPFGRSGY